MKKEQTLISVDDLDFYSSTPLYSQIVTYINRKISDGSLKLGDLLPSEISLCNDLGISRSTLRKAFKQLEQDGKISRKPGRGTVVCKPKLRRSLNNLYNFSDEMRELGLAPSSKILRFEIEKPSPVVATQLQISELEKVYKIVRLRLADGRPLLLETAYIPYKICPTLSEESLSDSLYARISEYTGTTVYEAVETYEVISLSEKEARCLECKAGMPAFMIKRTSKNTLGLFFEYTTILAPGDRNRYEITLHRNDISYKKIL